jgi:hypothetical protein
MFTATLDPFLDFQERKSGMAGTDGRVWDLSLSLPLPFLGGVVGTSGMGGRCVSVLLRPRRGETSGEETDLRVRKPKLLREGIGLGGVDVEMTVSTAAVRLC